MKTVQRLCHAWISPCSNSQRATYWRKSGDKDTRFGLRHVSNATQMRLANKAFSLFLRWLYISINLHALKHRNLQFYSSANTDGLQLCPERHRKLLPRLNCFQDGSSPVARIRRIEANIGLTSGRLPWSGDRPGMQAIVGRNAMDEPAPGDIISIGCLYKKTG